MLVSPLLEQLLEGYRSRRFGDKHIRAFLRNPEYMLTDQKPEGELIDLLAKGCVYDSLRMDGDVPFYFRESYSNPKAYGNRVVEAVHGKLRDPRACKEIRELQWVDGKFLYIAVKEIDGRLREEVRYGNLASDFTSMDFTSIEYQAIKQLSVVDGRLLCLVRRVTPKGAEGVSYGSEVYYYTQPTSAVVHDGRLFVSARLRERDCIFEGKMPRLHGEEGQEDLRIFGVVKREFAYVYRRASLRVGEKDQWYVACSDKSARTLGPFVRVTHEHVMPDGTVLFVAEDEVRGAFINGLRNWNFASVDEFYHNGNEAAYIGSPEGPFNRAVVMIKDGQWDTDGYLFSECRALRLPRILRRTAVVAFEHVSMPGQWSVYFGKRVLTDKLYDQIVDIRVDEPAQTVTIYARKARRLFKVVVDVTADTP